MSDPREHDQARDSSKRRGQRLPDSATSGSVPTTTASRSQQANNSSGPSQRTRPTNSPRQNVRGESSGRSRASRPAPDTAPRDASSSPSSSRRARSTAPQNATGGASSSASAPPRPRVPAPADPNAIAVAAAASSIANQMHASPPGGRIHTGLRAFEVGGPNNAGARELNPSELQNHLANTLEAATLGPDPPVGLASTQVRPRLVGRRSTAQHTMSAMEISDQHQIPNYCSETGFVIAAKPNQTPTANNLEQMVEDLARRFNQTAPRSHPLLVQSLVPEGSNNSPNWWSLIRIGPHPHYRANELGADQSLIKLRSPTFTMVQSVAVQEYTRALWTFLRENYIIRPWYRCHLNVRISFNQPLDLNTQKKLVTTLIREENTLVSIGQKGGIQPTPESVGQDRGLRRNWKENPALMSKSLPAALSDIYDAPTERRLQQFFQAGNQGQLGKLYFAELHAGGTLDLRYWPADVHAMATELYPLYSALTVHNSIAPDEQFISMDMIMAWAAQRRR